MQVLPEGWSVRHPRADTFRFLKPIERRKIIAVSDTEELLHLSGGERTPDKALTSLLAPGVAFHFPIDAAFRLTSTRAPLLTWDGGSAGEGVPTAESPWLVVSFRDDQPPVALAWQGRTSSWIVEGAPGAWLLRTVQPTSGWLRVGPAVGSRSRPTNTAAELGEMLAEAKPMLEALVEPAPKLLERRAVADAGGVTVTWTFDREGAVVPPAALLATVGGYPVYPQTPIQRTALYTEEGPLAFCLQPTLKLRFRQRAVPSGMAVTLGEPTEGIATASAHDPPSLCELALGNLLASRETAVADGARATHEQFLNEVPYAVEPATGQLQPLAPDLSNVVLLAAHAVLAQSLAAGDGRWAEPNALLMSLAWARDWATWKPYGVAPESVARAGSLAALAGALRQDPDGRADAALFEAGVAAQRGFRRWAPAVGWPAPSACPEPFVAIREALFLYERRGSEPAYVSALLSPIRLLGGLPVIAQAVDEGVQVAWTLPDSRAKDVHLVSVETGLQVAKLDGAFLRQDGVIRATREGLGSATFNWPTALPEWAEPPRYEETLPPDRG